MSMGPPWLIKYISPLYYAALRFSQRKGVSVKDVAATMRRPVRVVASMIEKAGVRLEELSRANSKGDEATLEDFNTPGHADMKAAGLEYMLDVEKMLVAGTLDGFLKQNNLLGHKKPILDNLRIFQDMRASRR